MSTLLVEVVKIKEINSHPNADRLELATVKGWQVVVQKDLYQQGDKVIYIPIDSILPPELEEELFPSAKLDEDVVNKLVLTLFTGFYEIKDDIVHISSNKVFHKTTQEKLLHPESKTGFNLTGIKEIIIDKNVCQINDKELKVKYSDILTQEFRQKILQSRIKLDKSRVKSIKIRKALSQGMIIPLSYLPSGQGPWQEGDDVKDILGITKFEPPKRAQAALRGNQASKKQVNPNFNKYTNLEHFKNYPDVFDEDDEVVITEKIHGCIQAKTKIRLFDGSNKTIQEIVENKLDVELLGFDNNGSLIPAKILNWFDNGISEDWYSIKITNKDADRGNHFRQIICTSNHQFYNPTFKRYVQCQALNTGDDVLMSRQKLHLSYIQEQILIGKMLGDGCLSKNHIEICHKKEHEKYIDYTLQCLGDIAGNKQKIRIGGYGYPIVPAKTKANRSIKELFTEWYTTGKKQVPKGIKLSPISLAFWYMDDGSLAHWKNQLDRAQFATCSFNEDSHNYLIQAFNNYGINPVIVNGSDGYRRLRINSDDADKFFSIVAPYIPKIMQYKLPERFRGQQPVILSAISRYKPDLINQTILSIDKLSDDKLKRINKSRYDLETTTHNFIANNIIVHNSSFRAGYVPADPYNWLMNQLPNISTPRLVKRFTRKTGLNKIKFRWLSKSIQDIKSKLSELSKPILTKIAAKIAPKHEWVYGSRNVQLQDRQNSKQTYYDTNVYAECIDNYYLKKILKDDEVIYGEIYGSGIQKNYTYGCKEGERRFVIYDVKVDGQWLSHDKAVKFCKDKGLPYVPILYRGLYDKDELVKLTTGKSVLNSEQKVREGAVIRSTEEEVAYMGRKVLKYINDDYLLLKGQSDLH
jgi:intein/homing endonuclease